MTLAKAVALAYYGTTQFLLVCLLGSTFSESFVKWLRTSFAPATVFIVICAGIFLLSAAVGLVTFLLLSPH